MDKLTSLETKIDNIDDKLIQQTADFKAFMTLKGFTKVTEDLEGIGDRYIAYKARRTRKSSLIEKWHDVYDDLNLLEKKFQPGFEANFFETQIKKSENYGSCLKLADTRLVHESK